MTTESDRNAVRCSVSIRPFLAASLYMAHNDIRYYLRGIMIEPAPQGGCYIVATNGSTMFAYIDPTATLEGAKQIVVTPSKSLLASAKSVRNRVSDLKDDDAPNQRRPFRVLVTGRRLSIAPDFGHECTQHEVAIQPGDCHIAEGWTYPDWLRVFPKFADLKMGQNLGIYSSNWLVQANQAQELLRQKRLEYSPLAFWSSSANDPLVVQFIDPQAAAIIMPMREDLGPFGFAKTLSDRRATIKAAELAAAKINPTA